LADSTLHVALLRGINVGGKNMLPMSDLTAMFVAAGCADVETYIQSGNVVCRARPAVAKKLPAAVATAILKRSGYRVPVVLRTADELRDVARGNPFLTAGGDPDTLHVAFLAGTPKAGGVAALDPRRSPPDEFVVRGREIYLRLPNGVARSKLTNAYFDKALATTSTVRNWRTVLKLHGLVESRASP
jgi:uncharacterized protein (DUF1697 family)